MKQLILSLLLAVLLVACGTAHRYQPLKLTSLDLGQSRTISIYSTGLWRNTGIKMHRGEVYRAATQGTWSAGGFCGPVTAAGLAVEHLACMKSIFSLNFPLPEGKIGALVGKIGANGKVFLIGSTEGFIADSDGILFMRMNDPDGFLWDNSGKIEVAVQRYGENVNAISFGAGRTGKVLQARSARDDTAKLHGEGKPPLVSKTKLKSMSRPEKAKANSSPSAQLEDGSRPRGVYRFDEEITFNVLDTMAIDPATGLLSLVGHSDPRYSGARIPYLQHLGAFLDNPRPEFSLEWTQQSEAKVEDFLRRMDDPAAMRSFASGLGEWLDPSGRPTALGRQMLSLIGITPTERDRSPGYLGAEVRGTGDWYIDVVRVMPGSPAERAGLRAGDSLGLVNRRQIWHPSDFLRLIRRAGAGGKVTFVISRPGYTGGPLTAILGAASEDRWKHMNRYDILSMLFSKTGMANAARVIDALGRYSRITGQIYKKMALEDLIGATGQYDNREALSARYNRGELSANQWRGLVMRGVSQGIERAFRLSPGTLTRDFDAELAKGASAGNAFTATLRALDRQLLKIGESALRNLFNRLDEVIIPASLAEALLGVAPQVHPRYIGMRSDTLLARVMFEADYLAKAIVEMPDLSKRITAYQTQFVFYGKHPATRSPMGRSITQRLWISIDRVPLVQSPNGHTLSIGDVDMRFNIADVPSAVQGGSSSTESANGYGEFLTSLYDDLAAEFPVLHELREAAKLAAVSRWLRARWPDFRLPANGQSRWQGPETLDGVVYLMWEPQGARVQIAAVGGISMVPPIGPSGPVNALTVSQAIPTDTSVVDLSQSNLTVVPAIYNNTAMRRILSRKIDVPVPRPPGWVARASKGGRTLKALNVVVPVESTACNADTWMALEGRLESIRMIARQLAGVENAINLITEQAPARQAEFAALERDLVEARQEFIDKSLNLISQGLLDSKDVLRNQVSIRGLDSLNQNIEAMQEAKEMTSSVEGKLNDLALAWRVAEADDIESRNKAVKDLLDYTRDLLVDADIKGDDTLSRSLRTAGKTFGRLNKIKSALEYGSTLHTLGQAALRMRTLGPQTAKESQALRDSLLPMQRNLSDRLDAELKNPLVQNWMEKRAKVDC